MYLRMIVCICFYACTLCMYKFMKCACIYVCSFVCMYECIPMYVGYLGFWMYTFMAESMGL